MRSFYLWLILFFLMSVWAVVQVLKIPAIDGAFHSHPRGKPTVHHKWKVNIDGIPLNKSQCFHELCLTR